MRGEEGEGRREREREARGSYAVHDHMYSRLESSSACFLFTYQAAYSLLIVSLSSIVLCACVSLLSRLFAWVQAHSSLAHKPRPLVA